jgi:predicted dehydrogenase
MRRQPSASGHARSTLRPRLGWAVAGLGNLTLEQILPAFARCRYSRPVALISADRATAAELARRYRIREDAVYDERTVERLSENAEVGAVYVVLPAGKHAEIAMRAVRAGKHVLFEPPIAAAADDCERTVLACRALGHRRIAFRRSRANKNAADPLALELDQFSLAARAWEDLPKSA